MLPWQFWVFLLLWESQYSGLCLNYVIDKAPVQIFAAPYSGVWNIIGSVLADLLPGLTAGILIQHIQV